MSASVISSNISTKISGGGTLNVSISGTATLTTTANEYAKVFAMATATTPGGQSGTLSLAIGGINFYLYSQNGSTDTIPYQEYIVPPSSSLTITISGSAGGQARGSYVKFINSP